MDNWFCILQAAINGDKEACIKYSEEVRYLIGGENEVCAPTGRLEKLAKLVHRT